MTEERLARIETALAHQEQQIADLSEMLDVYRREIDVLKRRLEIANSKLADLEIAGQEGQKSLSVTEQAARDKPPHY